MSEQKESLVTGKMQSRCCLWNSFSDPSLERLYQSYSVKQKRAGLECFLMTAILFDIYMLVVPSGQDVLMFGVMSSVLVVNCILLVWCKRGAQKCPLWPAVPHISWHIANAQLLASLFLKKNEVTSRDSLGWVLLLDYLIYVTLPLRLRYCTMLSVGTCLCYLAAIIGLSKSDANFIQQKPIFDYDFSTNRIDPLYNVELYEKELKFRLQCASQTAQKFLEKAKLSRKNNLYDNSKTLNLQIGSLVMITNENRSKLDNWYTGSYTVTNIDEPNCTVKDNNGKSLTVHKNRVEVYSGHQ